MTTLLILTNTPTTGTSLALDKRQTEELSRWLQERLSEEAEA